MVGCCLDFWTIVGVTNDSKIFAAKLGWTEGTGTVWHARVGECWSNPRCY